MSEQGSGTSNPASAPDAGDAEAPTQRQVPHPRVAEEDTSPVTVPAPPRRRRRLVGVVIVVSLLLLAGAVTAGLLVLAPTPAERFSDLDRALAADHSLFKNASDDEITQWLSGVCRYRASSGDMKPGAWLWSVLIGGRGMHPESVSREDFVEAVDDFCAAPH